MVAPGVRREAVAHVVAVHGVSQRRACKALALDRSSVRYRSVRPDDAEAGAAMKAVAAERRLVCPSRVARFESQCMIGLWFIGMVVSGAGGR